MIDAIHLSDEEIHDILRPDNLDGLVIVGSGLVETSKDFRQRLDRKIIELRGTFPIMGLGFGALWLTEICGVGYQALEVSKIIEKSPLFTPKIPRWGKPFRTKITNAGDWGWKSDKGGYGYVKKNPENGKKWPEIPEIFIKIW